MVVCNDIAFPIDKKSRTLTDEFALSVVGEEDYDRRLHPPDHGR
jgi:hypothetical protein